MEKLKKVNKVLNVLDKIDRISNFDKFVDVLINKKQRQNSVIAIQQSSVAGTKHQQNTHDEAKHHYQPPKPSSIKHHLQKKRFKLSLLNRIPKRILKDPKNPLESTSTETFHKIYGFSKQTVLDLLSMISYGLEKPTNRGHPINPMTELLLTLQFLKHGALQTKNIRISQPTISRIIKRVTGLLAELKLRFIKIPERSKFKAISAQFYKISGFPQVCGCVGSSHVPIKSPGKAIADDFLNENSFYSFRVMVSRFLLIFFVDLKTRTYVLIVFCLNFS